jgi:hypothetical protein
MFWHDLLNEFYVMSECRVHSSCQLEVHCFASGSGMEPCCYYHVHQNPPLIFPVLSQTNPAHIPVFLPHFLKIYFNVILSSVPNSSYQILWPKFCMPFPSVLYTLHFLPISSSIFLITQITCAEEYCSEVPYLGILQRPGTLPC